MGIAHCDSYKVVGTPKSNLFLLWWASLIGPSSIFVKLCEQFSIEAPHFSPFIKVVYMQAELYPNNMGQMKVLVETKDSKRMTKKGLHTTQSTMIHFSQLPSPVNYHLPHWADCIHSYFWVCCCGLSEEKEPNNPHMYPSPPPQKEETSSPAIACSTISLALRNFYSSHYLWPFLTWAIDND
jgi:hypothetical protein